MTTAGPQTPQRPLPGSFLNTPALNRQTGGSSSTVPFPAPSLFKSSNQPPSSSSNPQNALSTQVSKPDVTAGASSKGMTLIERAARTVNNVLNEESSYPPLDDYISQGFSSAYDLPTSSSWAPFQKIKTYEIPDQIFEQYNQAQVSTMMGLFAEINHAWVSIDNALYLWDYTDPNPQLIGFEEQHNSIAAVRLVKPRAGVFVEAIKRLLVVATTSEIILIGVATEPSPTGSTNVQLYQTGMKVSIRGINVHCIEGSAKSGRIFFTGKGDHDIWELTYQQEEKWFQNACSKINHTSKGFATFVPSFQFSQKPLLEYVTEIVVDDSRNLLYTLSSRSTIRAFHLKSQIELNLSLTRTHNSILSDLGHRVGPTTLLDSNTSIVSLSPITLQEATRVNLIATTSTGCRIYFSAVTSSFFGGDANSAPTSMQVHHVKFPPRDDVGTGAGQASSTSNLAQPTGGLVNFQAPPAAENAKSLTFSRFSSRFPPGYFLCLVQKTPQSVTDELFLCAPDAGRIARPQDPSQANRFPEWGSYIYLESRAEDVGLITPPFSASATPMGFGNELAVQFDQSTTEFAILTNTGVQTFRRRRLVDIFAATMKYGGSDEGLDGEIRNFARMYGRGETNATALAVACGQASEISVDSRIAKITDPDIIAYARKAFIDHGGKPSINENSVMEQGAPAIDNVRPSPRHEGLARYIARLLRSVWRAKIVLESSTPTGGLQVKPAVPISKLQDTQRNLTRLQEFLNTNKIFIEGLAGPEALGRVSTKQEEVALQGEHRALNSLVTLISDVIEGISFVLVLFDERVEEILLSITEAARQHVREMSFERLFCTAQGKDVAKELVKAIVNRNIASGANVDTVTDALRRRCGSFCSAEDCVIFKAQEQLKRASDASATSETSRKLLNESLGLLDKVAANLSMEQLGWAVQQYISMDFFGGAIKLILKVAQESDRGNQALAWFNDGSPGQDSRKAAFESRSQCYELIHQVINAVDHAASQSPEMVDGHYTVAAKRKREAYDEINRSRDELFQINLYDWYLSQGWSERLLEIESSFVVSYLQRKSVEDITRADLLWRYYARYNDFLESARVQLQLAQSSFDLTLDQRIEYLSQAKANASTAVLGLANMGRSRQTRQEVIREVSDLLEVANIQVDILQRIRADTRVTEQARPQLIKNLNGRILPVDELYNTYADQASYYDLCLLIYYVADHRNASDIRSTWQNLLDTLHRETEAAGEALPYEVVSEKLRVLGSRLNLSESVFPVSMLLPMLLRYAFEYQRHVGNPHWVVEAFLVLQVPFDTLLMNLEGVFYNNEVPFQGRNRRAIVSDIVHVVNRWLEDGLQNGGGGGGGSKAIVFGGEDGQAAVMSLLGEIARESASWDPELKEAVVTCRNRVERVLAR